MMKVLPSDFHCHKYGIDIRLVELSDAEFILTLRTDARLSKYIHHVPNDLDRQIQWIKDYKCREKAGLDYYFIYSYNGEPYGLNRIYNINTNDNSCTGGSWVCKQGTSVYCSMVTQVIVNELKFELLGLDVDNYDVRKGNKQVLFFHKSILEAEIIGETDIDILFRLTKDTYQVGNKKIKQMLQIPE